MIAGDRDVVERGSSTIRQPGALSGSISINGAIGHVQHSRDRRGTGNHSVHHTATGKICAVRADAGVGEGQRASLVEEAAAQACDIDKKSWIYTIVHEPADGMIAGNRAVCERRRAGVPQPTAFIGSTSADGAIGQREVAGVPDAAAIVADSIAADNYQFREGCADVFIDLKHSTRAVAADRHACQAE